MRAVATAGIGPTCAVLDAAVFAHAAPALHDLRLFEATIPVPYAVTLSEPTETTTERATLVNVRPNRQGVAFNLRMPSRPYTEVRLDIPQTDFLWTATVYGSSALTASPSTLLGTFTLFDLTAQHLPRSTILPLQESSFPYLHIQLHGPGVASDSIHGAQLPPSREAQTIYTTIARSAKIDQRGTDSVTTFRIPAHVPIERVSIDLLPGATKNFLRPVRVTGRIDAPDRPEETIAGTITRVHLPHTDLDRLSFPAAMGINLQQDATIEVSIQNDRDKPLAIDTVSLEMRQRSICFTSPPRSTALFYGNPNLSAPHNTPPTLPSPSTQAGLGPETPNPAFRPDPIRSPAERTSTTNLDRIWFVLLLGVGVAGTLILRALRRP